MSGGMRRSDRQLSDNEAIKILTCCEHGFLACCGNDAVPYAVPLNYAYADNHIYFHSATEGRKLRNIADNSQVSFSVVSKSVIDAAGFTCKYRSAIAFGTAALVNDPEEKNQALRLLIDKYSPDFQKEGAAYISKAAGHTAVVKIVIRELIGKGNSPG